MLALRNRAADGTSEGLEVSDAGAYSLEDNFVADPPVLVFEDITTALHSTKRLDYLAEVDLDVQVFQDLPLYIRPRVLAEGRVLYCRDEDRLYDVAFATMRAFGRFKRTYRAYLDEVEHGRP